MKKLSIITKVSFIFFMSLVLSIVIWSCTEDDDPLAIEGPKLTSLSPEAGFIGDKVTINGVNFSTVAALNAVSFNGTAATVIAVNAIAITTTVPLGATTGDLTVTTNGKTSNAVLYTVLVPIIPTITSLTPDSGEIGDEVVITGTKFSTTPKENKVSFNGIAATVTASTATSITTTVPAGASTGNITVTRDGKSNGVMFTVTTPIITLEVSITESLDDIEENIENGQVNDTGSSDLELGEFDTSGTPDNGLQVIGLRFQGITIPAGATIQTASIQFMSESADAEGASECQMTIFGESVGNSVAFDALVQYSVAGRTKTTASVIWNIPAWLQDEVSDNTKTVDIASVIQEIVDRGDWASGNSLSIIMEPTGISATATSDTQGREASTFDGNLAPKLTISYSE